MNATPELQRRDSPESLEDSFRLLAEQWPGAVLLFGADGRLTWFNDAALAWLPSRGKAALGRDGAALFARWQLDDAWREALSGATLTRQEHTPLVDADARPRWAQLRLQTLLQQGAVAGAVCIIEELDASQPTALVTPLDPDSALSANQVGLWSWNFATGEAAIDPGWCNALQLNPCPGPDFHARWTRQMHPDDLLVYRRRVEEFKSGATGYLEVEYRILTTDNRWLWILQRGDVVQSAADGAALRAAGICIEIDERKREENVLRENESRLATALWGARAAFWQWHRPTDTRTPSPLWYAMTGYTRDQWFSVPDPWQARLHPDDLAPTMAKLDSFRGMSGTDSLEIEYRVRTAKGEYKWMLDRARVVEWDPAGPPALIMGVSLDIDAQKAIEGRLRETEARLQTAMWGARMGLCETDCITGHTRWFNDWCEQLGIDPCSGEDHVSTWDDNIHPDDVLEAQRRYFEHINNKSDYYDAEYRIRAAGGDWRWIFERGRVVERFPDGRAIRMVGVCMDIDSRKTSQGNLTAVQESLETALQIARAGVWQVEGVDWTSTFSDGYFQLLGVPPAKGRVTPNFFETRVHPDDRYSVEQTFLEYASGRSESFEQEYRMRHDDGRWIWVLGRGRAVTRDDSGVSRRVVGFIMDITSRRAADDAVRQSEERLRVVANLTPGYIFEARLNADGSTDTVFVSDSFDQMMGCSHAEFVTRGSWTWFCDPQSSVRLANACEGMMAGKHTDVELLGNNARGDQIWLRMLTMPLFDRATGKHNGFIALVQDITGYREQQQNLHLQGRIIETIHEGVALMDREACILLSNPALDAMFGYDRGQLVGRHASSLSALNAAGFKRMLQRVLVGIDDGDAPTLELDGIRPDGTRLTVTCMFTGIEIGGDARIVVVVSDATERKQLERQVLQIATREQQRIGGDLHDGLGQQLTGIALMLKGLLPRLKRAGPDVRSDVEQIVALVNDAIDSTRSLARGLSPVRAGRDGLLMGLEELVSKTSERYQVKVALDYSLPETLDFDGDTATQLYRIAQEALGNAVRHGEATRVTIHLAAEAGQIELVVRDNGSGFDRRLNTGAGMGLKIMRFRAQMAGGDLVVESEVGQGTTVRCQCPMRTVPARR